MNNVLSKELFGKKLTYNSNTFSGVANGAVNGSASTDLAFKTTQPIYIEAITVKVNVKLDDVAAGFNINNETNVINDGKLFIYTNHAIILHSSKLIPAANDFQIVTGATEYNAAAKESKQNLLVNRINPVERIIVGNFGVSFSVQVYRMGGAAGGVFNMSCLVGIHYALIDGSF